MVGHVLVPDPELAPVLGEEQSAIAAQVAAVAVLDDDFGEGVDGLGHPRELDLPVLDIADAPELYLLQHLLDFGHPVLEGTDDQLVVLPADAVDRVQVLLDVGNHGVDLLLALDQLGDGVPGVLLGVLALKEDVVVALVLLQLQGLHNGLEVLVYLLDLGAVELLGVNQDLANLRAVLAYLLPGLAEAAQEVLNLLLPLGVGVLDLALSPDRVVAGVAPAAGFRAEGADIKALLS